VNQRKARTHEVDVHREERSSKGWLCVELLAPCEAADPLSAVLQELGCLGVRETARPDRWHAEAYFPLRTSYATLERTLTGAFERFAGALSLRGTLRIRVRRVPARDWELSWRRSLKPFNATARIVVRPTVCEYRPKQGEIVITMDPRMAFGSGHHETTRLALAALEELVVPGCSVLDAGAGTGILSIASTLLGAGRVIALEVDPDARDNLVENIRLNRVEDRIEAVFAPLAAAPREAVDIVAANIDRNVLLESMALIADLIAAGGVAVVTGILTGEAEEIERRMQSAGLNPIRRCEMGDWALLAGRKTGPRR
jgi:ribosomal protein L11 methyltransferase